MKVMKIVGIIFLGFLGLVIIGTLVGGEKEQQIPRTESAAQSSSDIKKSNQTTEIKTLKDLQSYADDYANWITKQARKMDSEGSVDFDMIINEWIERIRPFDSARRNYSILLSEFKDLTPNQKSSYSDIFSDAYNANDARDAFTDWVLMHTNKGEGLRSNTKGYTTTNSFVFFIAYNTKSSLLSEYKRKAIQKFKNVFPELTNQFYEVIEEKFVQ